MPRTDAVLADPQQVSAVAVLGRATVNAVVGRVERGRLLVDLRCVPTDRDGDVYVAVREA